MKNIKSIKIIGYGGALDLDRGNSSFLIENESGKTLLFDCGLTVPQKLNRLNIPIESIDYIYISHLHFDHVGGLQYIIFHNLFKHNKKTNLILPDSPSNFKDLLWESLKSGMEVLPYRDCVLEDYVNIYTPRQSKLYIPIPKATTTSHINLYNEFVLEFIPNNHIHGNKLEIISTGLLINNSVLISGDCLNYDSLLPVIRNELPPTIIILDYFSEVTTGAHPTRDDLMRFIRAFKRNSEKNPNLYSHTKIYLTHYSVANTLNSFKFQNEFIPIEYIESVNQIITL